ncbi:MAG: haloacid dehalogenase type II [Candidatus Rokubacteria bacterium]|nr:haloacid dehalogenase type II [Candidatus Rokubacteria bacterium]
MATIDFASKQVLSFDCYGTLIDWETGILAALRPILSRHGVTVDADRMLTLYGEIESTAEHGPYRPYREVLTAVVSELGTRLGITISGADAARFADSVGDWPPFADTRAALAALKHRFRLAIISNVDDDLFARTNQQLGVEFDWIVTAQQVGSYKPSPNNFHHALARFGLPKAAILHVAQSLFHDHVPAKQLGLDTVWLNRRHGKAGFGATPPATARPDLEVPDLATLARLANAT